jgi:predicted amidohydrolase YtcJ
VFIHNANIYLFDEHDTTADSILIEGGRIQAVGPEHQVRSRGSEGESLDARGATILPGLIDTHPHLLHFAAGRAALVDITDARSHAEIVQRIAERARSTRRADWSARSKKLPT